MFKENVKALGTLSIYKNNVEVFYADNLVVGTGLAFIANKMIDGNNAVMTHMALGAGTTDAVTSDTTLETENGRVALDSASNVNTNVAGDSVQFVATFPAGTCTGALTEAGLFNDATAGAMLSRTNFAVVNKSELDSIAVTWKIVIV